MLLALAPLAASLAAERPSNEALDDLGRWERGMDRLLSGPEGCWDLEAKVTQTFTIHQPPDLFSTARSETYVFEGPMRGRLKDGIWVSMSHEVKLVSGGREKDRDLDLDVPVFPLMGQMKRAPGAVETEELSISVSDEGTSISGGIGQSLNVLKRAIDEWSGSTETAISQWDEAQGAVLLLRELPVSDEDDRPIKVTARFPLDAFPPDKAMADRVDAAWPRVVRVGQWPLKVTIRDAQMHVVGFVVEDKVLPRLESISLVAGVLGYTAGVEQGLRFVAATPCRDETPAEGG